MMLTYERVREEPKVSLCALSVIFQYFSLSKALIHELFISIYFMVIVLSLTSMNKLNLLAK